MAGNKQCQNFICGPSATNILFRRTPTPIAAYRVNSTIIRYSDAHNAVRICLARSALAWHFGVIAELAADLCGVRPFAQGKEEFQRFPKFRSTKWPTADPLACADS